MTTAAAARVAVTRPSVCVAVPLLAVGAHRLAGGEFPGPSEAILVAGIGLIAGLLTSGARFTRVVGILTGAQVASHAVLMMAHGELWAVDDPTSMTVTHLLAIPASALAIVVVAQLVSLITSTIRAVVGSPVPVPPDRCPIAVRQPMLRGSRVVERHGIRGPPTASSALRFV